MGTAKEGGRLYRSRHLGYERENRMMTRRDDLAEVMNEGRLNSFRHLLTGAEVHPSNPTVN